MSLGSSLMNARKKCGLSQEKVAEKLGVSRQTISKWELDETLPDIRQAKKLSALYRVTLDELIDFDVEVREIEEMIEKTSEETQKKVDWTKVWSQKYPCLRPISRWSGPMIIRRSSGKCWRGSGGSTVTAKKTPFWS